MTESKSNNSKSIHARVMVLDSACCLMLIDIYMNFHEDSLNGFQVIERTQVWQRDAWGKINMSPNHKRGRHKNAKNKTKKQKKKTKQEAHGPRVAHLSDIATADIQMLCNIFPVLSSQIMKRSTFKQFLILRKNITSGMTVNGAWSFEQTLNHISTAGSMWNLEAIG